MDRRQSLATFSISELAFSKKKSKRQKGSCFDPINHGYEILEGGGTNIGGEDRGARKHKVVINEKSVRVENRPYTIGLAPT